MKQSFAESGPAGSNRNLCVEKPSSRSPKLVVLSEGNWRVSCPGRREGERWKVGREALENDYFSVQQCRKWSVGYRYPQIKYWSVRTVSGRLWTVEGEMHLQQMERDRGLHTR